MLAFRIICILFITNAFVYAQSPILDECNRVRNLEPLQSGHLKGCSSYDHYYGLHGKPIDYVKARECAVAELESEHGKDIMFSGYSILMMVYANGFGVERNIDLAIKYACLFDMESTERIRALIELKISKRKAIFDVCDHVTLPDEAHCMVRNSELASQEREKNLSLLTSKWNFKEKDAFRRLRKAAAFYFSASAEYEQDLSHEAVSRTIFAEESFEDQFYKDIVRFQKGERPVGSAHVRENLLLIFQKLVTSDCSLKAGIIKTHALWKTYQDAWIRYGEVVHPNIHKKDWLAWTSADRLMILNEALTVCRGS